MSDSFALDRLTVRVACDLDGVLIDNAKALVEAYRRAGVVNRPNRPWHEWCTPEQHDAKNRFYSDELRRYGRLTAFARCAFQPGWVILTGASSEAVASARIVLGLVAPFVICGLTVDDKIGVIEQHRIQVYFDDDPAAVAEIERKTKCQCFLTSPR